MARILTPVHYSGDRGRRTLYGAVGFFQIVLVATVLLVTSRGALLTGLFAVVLAGSLLATYSLWRRANKWLLMAEGERTVAEALARILPSDSLVLNDLLVPGMPGESGRIQHVICAPSGLFLVETSMLDGLIQPRDDFWYVRSGNSWRRVESPGSTLEERMRALQDELVRVANKVSPDPAWIDRLVLKAIVVLAHRRAVFEGNRIQADGAIVLAPAALTEYFRQQFQQKVQTPSETLRAAAHLGQYRT